MIQDILRYGQVHSAWIGAVTATITPEEARRTGLRASRGALVARVISGSPAQAAGLAPATSSPPSPARRSIRAKRSRRYTATVPPASRCR